jgi:hypothetical protein
MAAKFFWSEDSDGKVDIGRDILYRLQFNGFFSMIEMTSDLLVCRKRIISRQLGRRNEMTSEFWHDFAEGWRRLHRSDLEPFETAAVNFVHNACDAATITSAVCVDRPHETASR